MQTRWCVCCALLLAGGCGGGAVGVPETREHPRTAAEEAVKKYLAGKHGEVEFLTWGPHLGGDELRARFKDSEIAYQMRRQYGRVPPDVLRELAKIDAIVRVRCRAGGQVRDELYMLLGGEVIPQGSPGEDPDNWHKHFQWP